MDLEKYKKIIGDAIQAEIEAKEFYEKISKGVKNEYLKELFEKFAKEEKKHEVILSNVLSNEQIKSSYFDFEKDFHVSETVEMPEVNADMDLKDAIGIAMKNEELAMKNYQALADNCEDVSLKNVFIDLSAMERRHKFKMEESFVNIAYPEVW